MTSLEEVEAANAMNTFMAHGRRAPFRSLRQAFLSPEEENMGAVIRMVWSVCF
jgi:hypothetical protein